MYQKKRELPYCAFKLFLFSYKSNMHLSILHYLRIIRIIDTIPSFNNRLLIRLRFVESIQILNLNLISISIGHCFVDVLYKLCNNIITWILYWILSKLELFLFKYAAIEIRIINLINLIDLIYPSSFHRSIIKNKIDFKLVYLLK